MRRSSASWCSLRCLLLCCIPLCIPLPGCNKDDCATLPPQVEVTLTGVPWDVADELLIHAQLGGETAKTKRVTKPTELQRAGTDEARFVLVFDRLTVTGATQLRLEVEALVGGVTAARAVSPNGLELQPHGCNRATLRFETHAADSGPDGPSPDGGTPDGPSPDGPSSDGPGPDGPDAAPLLNLQAAPADVELLGGAAGDELGPVIACDVDGDSVDDIVVAAPLAQGKMNTAQPARGRVYVFRSPVSPGSTLDLAPPSLPSMLLLLVYGPADNAKLGEALACGDVNADTIPDLVIGAPSANSGAGAVYVVFGTKSTTLKTIDHDSQHADVAVFGGSADARLGAALAVLRFTEGHNAADADALIIGAPGHDHDVAGTDAGAVFVLPGRTTWDAMVDLTAEPALLIHGGVAGEQLGWSLGGGGINRDGDIFDDLAVGGPATSAAPGARGVVRVFRGRDWGVSEATIEVDPNVVPHVAISGPFPASGRPPSTGFAESLAAGDLDGDKFDDLVIGAWNHGTNAEGRAYLFLGLDVPGPEDLQKNLDVDQDHHKAVYYGEPNSQFAASLATVSGGSLGSRHDLLVGAPGESAGYWLGMPAGFSSVVEIRASTSEHLLLRVLGGAGERLGASVASGQLDPSLVADVLLGARLASPSGRSNAGTVYALRGPPWPR